MGMLILTQPSLWALGWRDRESPERGRAQQPGAVRKAPCAVGINHVGSAGRAHTGQLLEEAAA